MLGELDDCYEKGKKLNIVYENKSFFFGYSWYIYERVYYWYVLFFCYDKDM